MDASQGFGALRESVQSALVTVTRTVNGLANEDLQFQRTVNPSVANQLDDRTERLLQLASGLLKSAGKATSQKVSPLEDIDDIDIQWRGVIDVIDSLLEKADTCLDEYTGLVKRKDASTADPDRNAKRLKPSNYDRLEWSLKRANILKPQNRFEKKPDNFALGPWKPLLTKKPHATVSLEDSLKTFTDEEKGTVQYGEPVSFHSMLSAPRSHEVGELESIGPNCSQAAFERYVTQWMKDKELIRDAHRLRYMNPYQTEIQSMQYPEEVYQKQDPQTYLPIETTSAIWVDTYEGVLEMLEELKKAKEIALDLEHHDYRSYVGLLSLMQISTREKDWIIDTLVPWRHKLEVLNEVFADPKIVKVLHGAFMDVVWLQRDLGLYLVGLFDTHHACGILGYSGKSLAFLLKKFVDFDADKKYQLADWRIRRVLAPLPEEMFYYARSDSHYLLYIYDMVRNELVERSDRSNPDRDLIDIVVQKSKDVALQRYENPSYEPETGLGSRGWFNTMVKSPTLYNGEQFAVYKAVHKWRDELARREDESPFFFMTQQVLADIARILPVDKKALWSLLDSNAKNLKSYQDELFDLIQTAKASGLNGPTMMDMFCGSSGTIAPKALEGQRLKTATEPVAQTLSIKDLRSKHSQLWGEIALSSVWDGTSKAHESNEILEIPLPYHHLVQGACIIDDAENLQRAAEVAAAAASRQGEQETEISGDQNFTLKTGRKRKHDEEVSVSDAESDSDADLEVQAGKFSASSGSLNKAEIPEGGSQPALTEREQKKMEKKKARREARALTRNMKRANKAAKKVAAAAENTSKQQQPADVMHEDDEQPFDYSKAEPVLHAAAKPKGGDRKPKKTFDPYTKKSGDAPRGARNLNHEKSGMTATFKK
ncbi:ribonuclease H-like domain-containing protein [Podospora didyma]|uniref:Ribonuclease H-like domain-containing protein n=1 Tax=Podospora didyma TaxID=330526 RepID=A0AAE0NNW5_9PEZI|nr:ribonuclease H-like domain-containing protein [Podospora didyma]